MGNYDNYYLRTKEAMTRYIPIKQMVESGIYEDLDIASKSLDISLAIQSLIEDNVSVEVEVKINDGTHERFSLNEYIDDFIAELHR